MSENSMKIHSHFSSFNSVPFSPANAELLDNVIKVEEYLRENLQIFNETIIDIEKNVYENGDSPERETALYDIKRKLNIFIENTFKIVSTSMIEREPRKNDYINILDSKVKGISNIIHTLENMHFARDIFSVNVYNEDMPIRKLPDLNMFISVFKNNTALNKSNDCLEYLNADNIYELLGDIASGDFEGDADNFSCMIPYKNDGWFEKIPSEIEELDKRAVSSHNIATVLNDHPYNTSFSCKCDDLTDAATDVMSRICIIVKHLRPIAEKLAMYNAGLPTLLRSYLTFLNVYVEALTYIRKVDSLYFKYHEYYANIINDLVKAIDIELGESTSL